MALRGVMARLEDRWARRQVDEDARWGTHRETVGVEASVVIEAPRQKVWDFITDPRSNPLVNELFVRSVHVPGTPTRGVGLQYRQETLDAAGQTVVSLLEIVEYEPPRRMARTLTAGSTSWWRVTLEEVPEGCRYTIRTELELPVGHGHLAEPRLRPAMTATLAEVKALVEADAARPSP